MIVYNHETIRTNGINLHVVQAGPEDGSLVILLHGFPEFWYGWRKQMDYLAEQGFRVWVPDQRGYNTSDKPKDIAAYNLDLLSDDVIGLIDAAGQEKVFLVGHDWGGAVAWWIANRTPERLKKLVILNVPHHAVMRRTLKHSWEQRRKSWYMLFFQLPWLPDALLTMNHSETLVRTLQSTSNPGTFSEMDFAEYRKAWSQPGAIKTMLNWYRAIFQTPPKRLSSPRISVPTLLLWGKRDTALSAQMAQASIELCDDGRLVTFDHATHWVQHEEAEQVNRHMAEFLQA